MNLLSNRTTYKPFAYPQAFELWEKQQMMHWLPSEVSLADDVQDWKTKLTKSELGLVSHIFRLFTQSDIEVSNAYLDVYIPVIKHPEVRMMLTAFANIETVHIAAYSHLLDTLGIPQSEYSAFLEYKELKNKYDYMHQFNNNSTYDLAIAMAVYGGIIEGLSLFASFAMLLNFQRFGKMKGMGTIVEWSIKDEALHVNSMAWLFRILVAENPELWEKGLARDITNHCSELVKHEDVFIDMAFSLGPIDGLTMGDMKQYIRYIADIRLRNLGLQPLYLVVDNPLPWIEEIINAPIHSNFFEARVTDYAKGATTGDWGDLF